MGGGPVRVTCPHCLQSHDTSVRECPETGAEIPNRYIRNHLHGERVASMLTVGWSGHGKTCYLASFMHGCYYDLPRAWPGFSLIGLNQATLDVVHDAYVNRIHGGDLPDRSPSTLTNRLILEMSDVPLSRKMGPLKVGYERQKLVLNLYDIGGEVYRAQETIEQQIDLIARLRCMTFLIDLSQVREEASTTGRTPESALQRLLDTILIAVDRLGPVEGTRMGIVVCFTKTDLLWHDPDFGPLAEPPTVQLPDASGMGAYIASMVKRSRAIGDWVRETYPHFYNALHHDFEPVAFTAVSALGTKPSDGRVQALRPSGLYDPLLSLLHMEHWV